jgi:L-lactate dehydrogenase complex protein LldG
VSSAREEILSRVRAAKQGAIAPPVPRDYHRTDELSHHDRVALFCERVSDYRAEVERMSASELAPRMSAAAARHGAQRLVIPAELPDEWRPDELELVADERLTPPELDQLDGVITGSTVAVAETGTIVLAAGPREGRRALTLVPDLHICVVESEHVVGTVTEAMSRLAPLVRDSRRPLTLISGPSATSDIELQRVEGVHGPRRLVVLVVER